MNDKPQWLKEISCVYCGQSEAENARLKELNRELIDALGAYMGVPTSGQCIDAESILKKVKDGRGK